MFELVLPPLFSGLSSNEYESFRKLGWKTGKINDIPEDRNITGILLSGTIKDQNEQTITPGRVVLGILPFVRQKRNQYVSDLYHEIAYIETQSIVEFFLQNPRAMQSYLQYCEHSGFPVIEKWKDFPDIYGIYSTKEYSESIHFSYSLAGFLSQDSEKIILLEMAKEGAGIFSFFNPSIPAALVQKQKDDPQKLEDIIEQRKISITEKIDLLNVTFLSEWCLSKKQWSVLYRVLRKKYKKIIIHFGKENPDYFFEEVNSLFFFSDDEKNITLYDHIRTGNYSMPIMFQIFPGKLFRSDKKRLTYPEGNYSEAEFFRNNKMLEEKFKPYYSFIENHFSLVFQTEEINIFGDSFMNHEGFFAFLELLSQKYTKDRDNKYVKKFLKENLNIFHGYSSFLAALIQKNENWEDALVEYKKIKTKKTLETFKPVYPEKGIFNPKPIHKSLYRIFSDIYQEKTSLFFSYFCSRTCTVHSVSSGLLIDNLLQVMYPAGLLDSLTPKQKKMQCVSENHWIQEISWLFRIGYKKINFYYFSWREGGEVSPLVKNFYQKENQLQFLYALSGKKTQIIVVPFGSSNSFEENKAEIYQEMKSILNF